MKSYFGENLSTPEFDFSDVRPKGAQLVTSGGKAPGPQPLKDCIHKLKGMLDAKEDGQKLFYLLELMNDENSSFKWKREF